MNYQRARLASVIGCSLLIFCGCGTDRPPLGYVSGKVTTSDDKPVANIVVTMKPDNGRAAIGVTNPKGEYKVEYTLGEKGTKIGPTTVSLEWPTGFAGPFPIPLKYTQSKSEIKFEVKKGSQTYDIKIEGASAGAAQSSDPKKPDAKPIIVD